jgi:hypothetical protein
MFAKALSIGQPFAGLIVLGLKERELRSWRTQYRGPLIVHASRRPARLPIQQRLPEHDVFRCFGMFIGVVELTECVRATPDDEGQAWVRPPEGWFSWSLERPRIFDKPWYGKGRLGLFSCDGRTHGY